MLKFVCLTLFVSLATANLNFKDCGNGEVKNVELSGCDQAPCTFHKGKEVTFNVVFTANEDSAKATIEIDAKIGELMLQLPNIETDACKSMSCPLKKGESKTLKYTMTVPATAPTTEADITVKLIGDGNKILGCGSIHGSIKP